VRKCGESVELMKNYEIVDFTELETRADMQELYLVKLV
jgi:hypothetical protein